MRNTFFLLVFLGSFGLFSQNKGIVKGTITDLETDNEPLLFADVALKGADLKTRTNFNGNFEIVAIAPGKYTLEIGFLGYETLNIAIEVSENSVTEIRKGLSARSIVLDPAALSHLESVGNDDALAALKRNMEN